MFSEPQKQLPGAYPGSSPRAGDEPTAPAARAATRRFGAAHLLAGAAAVLILAGCGASTNGIKSPATQSRFDGMAATGLTAPNFTLHDQHGQSLSLSSEHGKFVIITFLYVHCKNVCPVIAQQLNQALRELSPAARNEVRVLAVSVDPKGDTPAAVAHFIAVHRLLPQFLYLTGSVKTLEAVWAGYHIASTQTGSALVVGHTAIEILLNRDLQPQTVYDATVTPQQVLHDLRVLGLQE